MRYNKHKAAAALFGCAACLSILAGCVRGDGVSDAVMTVEASSSGSMSDGNNGQTDIIDVQQGDADDGGPHVNVPAAPSARPGLQVEKSEQPAVPAATGSGNGEGADVHIHGVPDGQNELYLSSIEGIPDDFYRHGATAFGLDLSSRAVSYQLNNGDPYFDIPDVPLEAPIFSSLDDLGRPGPAYACIGLDTIADRAPAETFPWYENPAGWQHMAYPGLVPGSSLYRRARLVGSRLSTGRSDMKNLFTATQSLLDDAMSPVEAYIMAYVAKTGCHVAYRVTPLYRQDNLLCDAITIEAASIEPPACEHGPDEDCTLFCRPLRMNLLCLNIQPGFDIDYGTGIVRGAEYPDDYGNRHYIVDLSTGTYHEPRCSKAAGLHYTDRMDCYCQPDMLLDNGCEPCRACSPDQY